MAALAEALDQQLALHPQLESRIRAFFGANTTRAHLKMAEAPTGGWPRAARLPLTKAASEHWMQCMPCGCLTGISARAGGPTDTLHGESPRGTPAAAQTSYAAPREHGVSWGSP